MALLVKLAVVWLCATAGTAFGDSLVGVAFHDSESAYFAKAELFNEHSTIGPWKIVAPFPTNAFLKASSASGASEPYFAVECDTDHYGAPALFVVEDQTESGGSAQFSLVVLKELTGTISTIVGLSRSTFAIFVMPPNVESSPTMDLVLLNGASLQYTIQRGLNTSNDRVEWSLDAPSAFDAYENLLFLFTTPLNSSVQTFATLQMVSNGQYEVSMLTTVPLSQTALPVAKLGFVPNSPWTGGGVLEAWINGPLTQSRFSHIQMYTGQPSAATPPLRRNPGVIYGDGVSTSRGTAFVQVISSPGLVNQQIEAPLNTFYDTDSCTMAYWTYGDDQWQLSDTDSDVTCSINLIRVFEKVGFP